MSAGTTFPGDLAGTPMAYLSSTRLTNDRRSPERRCLFLISIYIPLQQQEIEQDTVGRTLDRKKGGIKDEKDWFWEEVGVCDTHI